MNIKNIYNRLRAAHDQISFFQKMLLVYLLCGFIPVIIALFLFYNSLERILLRDAYSTVESGMDNMQSSLDQMLLPYQTLMEVLKNDRNLHILLNMDYSRTSYVELADFAETTLAPMLVLYPELESIRFYCDNPTLPSDEYYFFQSEEMEAGLITVIEQSTENQIFYSDEHTRNTFALVSRMNYYSSEYGSNYLEFQINKSLLTSTLNSDSENQWILLDNSGRILLAEDNRLVNTEIRDLLPEWDSLEQDSIVSTTASDGTDYISMRTYAGMELSLLILMDENTVLKGISAAPKELLMITAVLIVLNAIAVFLMSRHMNRRLKRIQSGMKALGEGRFDEKLPYMGEDEFGKMADEVNHLGAQLDQLIQENYRKQLTLKSTELNLLQEQLNPHFLYNALAVISSLAMQEQGKRTVQSIRYLADFYRISLNKGRKIIYVKEEIDLLRNYMQIQLLRFSDLVEIDYDIDPEAEGFFTIKLILQPLVENAIHHAREEEQFLSIHVRARAEADRISFDVEDNGQGIPPEKLEQLQQELSRKEDGFGLKNVDSRIKLAYGEAYGVTIFSTQGEGTRIHVEIPKVTERLIEE